MRSKEIKSAQTTVHSKLEQVLNRHTKNTWKAPIKEHTKTAFRALLDVCSDELDAGFILDSGCGTGTSSLRLAEQNPERLVIGIAQSPQRLGRGELSAGDKANLESQAVRVKNCILLRAEAADFWRLLAQENLVPDEIKIYYPNPWPKPTHLLRRWHGHPVFPLLLKLGAPIEARSNWKIYLDEFALAAQLLGNSALVVEELGSESFEDGFVSPFEKKYFNSGHSLWRVRL